MFTPYSSDNQDFSDLAHIAARSLVYPEMLGCDEHVMSFESASVSDGGEKAIMDGQMAVDRIVKVSVEGLRGPIEHIIQERFRRTSYARYRDLTITEWNFATNQKSELHKLKAGFFLYGYFDETTSTFGEAIAVNTSAMLLAIQRKTVYYDTRVNQRTRQTFICLTFNSLIKSGVVVWHRKQDGGVTSGR